VNQRRTSVKDKLKSAIFEKHSKKRNPNVEAIRNMPLGECATSLLRI